MILEDGLEYNIFYNIPYGSIYCNLINIADDEGIGTIVVSEFKKLRQCDFEEPTNVDILKVFIFFINERYINLLYKCPEEGIIKFKLNIDIVKLVVNTKLNSSRNTNSKEILKHNRIQFTESQKIQVLSKTNCRCSYCGIELYKVKFHVEHLIPLSKGGTNDMENLLPSCSTCNIRKTNNDIERFRYMTSCRRVGITPLSQDILQEYEAKGFTIPKPESVKFYIEELKGITLGE